MFRPLNGAGAAYEKHAHPAVRIRRGRRSRGRQGRRRHLHVGARRGDGRDQQGDPATAAEQALIGKPANADTIAAAAARAADGLELNGDVYASAEYRGQLVKVLAKRAITRAAGL